MWRLFLVISLLENVCAEILVEVADMPASTNVLSHLAKSYPARSDYPKTPPYPPPNESIQNLKKWLLDQFATTVFNKSGKFPAMSGPPAHIHLKDGAIPKAKHNPIPVPYHYMEEVKKALWDDVERDIITPVPIGAVPWLLLQRKMRNQEGPWITST